MNACFTSILLIVGIILAKDFKISKNNTHSKFNHFNKKKMTPEQEILLTALDIQEK